MFRSSFSSSQVWHASRASLGTYVSLIQVRLKMTLLAIARACSALFRRPLVNVTDGYLLFSAYAAFLAVSLRLSASMSGSVVINVPSRCERSTFKRALSDAAITFLSSRCLVLLLFKPCPSGPLRSSNSFASRDRYRATWPAGSRTSGGWSIDFAEAAEYQNRSIKCA